MYRFCLLFSSEITLTDLCCLLYQDNIVMQFHSSILSVFAVVGSLVGHVHANTNIFINDAVAHDDVQLDTPSFTTLHGHSHSHHSHCGTYQPSPDEMAIQEEKFISLLKAKAKGNVASSFAARDKININVYFHVIMSSTATGNLTDTQITDQMSVLNNGFADTLFVFNLVSVDYTENDEWFNVGSSSQEEIDLKDALHMGGSADLNIYTAFLGEELAGWACSQRWMVWFFITGPFLVVIRHPSTLAPLLHTKLATGLDFITPSTRDVMVAILLTTPPLKQCLH